MPSDKFTSFAICGGSGDLGSHIVATLIAQGAAEVRVISRSDDVTVPAGAALRKVDYESLESITAALAGVEVSVSVLLDRAGVQEPLIARAARAAGVQLHLPSSWAWDSETMPDSSPLKAKALALRALGPELALPMLWFTVGLFPETTFTSGRFGWDFNTHRAEIVGDGEYPVSFTTKPSIGEYVGTLLTTLPRVALLAKGRVYIEGDRATFNQAVEWYHAAHADRPTLAVTHTPLDASDAFAEQTGGLSYFVRTSFNDGARGRADITRGGVIELDNALVASWEPESLRSWLARLPAESKASEPIWVYCDHPVA